MTWNSHNTSDSERSNYHDILCARNIEQHCEIFFKSIKIWQYQKGWNLKGVTYQVCSTLATEQRCWKWESCHNWLQSPPRYCLPPDFVCAILKLVTTTTTMPTKTTTTKKKQPKTNERTHIRGNTWMPLTGITVPSSYFIFCRYWYSSSVWGTVMKRGLGVGSFTMRKGCPSCKCTTTAPTTAITETTATTAAATWASWKKKTYRTYQIN